MGIQIGNSEVTKVYKGSTEVDKIYKGSSEVYCAFEPEAVALFARMDEQPNDALKVLINETIARLKEHGVWEHLDDLVMLCLHTSQASLLNWKGNYFNATFVNSPRWTPFYGVYGENTKYINFNYNPYSDGVNYTLGDAFYGMWFAHGVNTTQYSCGTYTGSYYNMFRNRQSAGTMAGSINTGQLLGASLTSTGKGLTLIERKDSANIYYVRNGIRNIRTQAIGTGIADRNLFGMCANYNDSPTTGYYYDRGQIFVVGGGMTEQLHTYLYEDLNYFISNMFDTYTYGNELIEDPGFDDANEWITAVGWVVGGSKATYDDTINAKIYPKIPVVLTLGKKYLVEYEVSDLTTNYSYFVIADQGGNSGVFHTYLNHVNGAVKYIATCTYGCTNIGMFALTSSGSSWSLNNISIKEIIE
jgi:hypothetical protein